MHKYQLHAIRELRAESIQRLSQHTGIAVLVVAGQNNLELRAIRAQGFTVGEERHVDLGIGVLHPLEDVFPQPLGPSSVRISPCSTSRVTPLTASTGPGQKLL